MANPNYPPLNVSEATTLLREDSSIIHEIINGDAATTVVVDDGNILPSLRKTIVDNFHFRDPIDWVNGGNVTKFNQLVKFTDGALWYAPFASSTNPILMGATPVGDAGWTLAILSATNLSRVGAITPIGNVLPRFIGDEYLDSSVGQDNWYKSINTTNTGWKILT